MTTEKENKKIYTILVKCCWIAFLAILLGFPLYIYSVSTNLFNLFGGQPSLEVLENPKNDLSSELYAADNVLLGKYYRENRSPVKYEDLSANLVNALIATEDHRYEKHSGIDLIGLARVFVYSIILQQDAGGGSTITQQLAKNLFKTRSEQYDGYLSNIPFLGLVIDKTKEWLVAVKLERSYTKKEILAMYLNTVPFGSNSYGIKVASKTFFNKRPDELNKKESAVLVGLLKAPSYYSPVFNPDNSRRRRNVVLSQMRKHGFIQPSEYDSLIASQIDLEYKVESHNEGLAPYFRMHIRRFLHQWTREHGYDLYEDGLKIYTTIDSRMQQHAEDAVKAHMKKLQKQFDEHWEGEGPPWRNEKGKVIEDFIKNAAKSTDKYQNLVQKYGEGSDSIEIIMNKPQKMEVFSWEGEKDTVMSPMDSIRYHKKFLHSGFMSMDPHTGNIKAWVGGINHKYFQYDHVKQGERQPGSAFKPIVYTAAIDNGYSPCFEVIDAPVTFKVIADGKDTTWTPTNASKEFTGERMTIRQAMARSKNAITAFLMKKLGPSTVVDYAQRLGIEGNLDPVPSLALGVADLSLYELVGAYSTFVNKGTYTQPAFITRIEDKNGNILQEFPPRTKEALNEETAYVMLHMLKGTTEEVGGTAMGLTEDLRNENEIGAKTGTTQNQSDGWFMGVTKNLVSGAWVGGDSRSIHFRSLALGQGARMAMPIWENYMKKIYNDERLDYEKAPFEKPANLSMELDCSKYKDGTQIVQESDSLENENKVYDEVNADEIF